MARTQTRRTARYGRGAASRKAASPAPLRQAVIYSRVSSREQEREGFSIPAQQELLRKYAADHGFAIVEEFTDVETAKKTGRAAFGRMLASLRRRTSGRPAIL